MTGTGFVLRTLILLCSVSAGICNTFAFTEEPSERVGKGDGYCSRILRAQGPRKEGFNEFRLRVEGDPESYHPGSTYRGLRETPTTDAHFGRASHNLALFNDSTYSISRRI